MKQAGAAEDVFDTSVKSLIHDFTGGLPRAINHLATTCLLQATARSVQRIDEAIAAIHAGGAEYVLGLVDMLGEPGSAADVKPRYALHCPTNHVLETDDEPGRKRLGETLAGALAAAPSRPHADAVQRGAAHMRQRQRHQPPV